MFIKYKNIFQFYMCTYWKCRLHFEIIINRSRICIKKNSRFDILLYPYSTYYREQLFHTLGCRKRRFQISGSVINNENGLKEPKTTNRIEMKQLYGNYRIQKTTFYRTQMFLIVFLICFKNFQRHCVQIKINKIQCNDNKFDSI